MQPYENFAHPGGLLDFHDSGGGSDKGRGTCRRFETPIGAML